MISVKAKYSVITRNRDEYFFYEYIEVSGHATQTNGLNHLKVCSSVTTIVNGLIPLLEEVKERLKVDKGYFRYDYNTIKYKDKVQIALDTAIYQLYYLYRNFGSYFKSFDLIEKKENI